MTMNFIEISQLDAGAVLEDAYHDGIRYLIVRGPCSICAYMGVPEGHPLSGIHYDDLPVSVHGGLTFSDKGDGKFRPEGFYWFGWDYAHAGDKAFYDIGILSDDKEWTTQEVRDEVLSAIYDFKKIVAIAEKAAKPT